MFKVIANNEVGPEIYQLVLTYDQLAEEPAPGQFFNLKVSGDGTADPLLRRPFSIFDFEKETKRIEFVYKVVGRGTKILTQLKKGAEIDILGPLGSPFTVLEKAEVDLIGGGMGIAPLYYLAKKLKESSRIEPSLYLGAASRAELDFFAEKFKALGLEPHLAADREKLEIKGTALTLWLNYLQDRKPEFVYSCGPEKMLAAVEAEVLKNKLKGELSVEKRMGCGIGICLSCSCRSKSAEAKNKRACVEGPVFEFGEVVIDG